MLGLGTLRRVSRELRLDIAAAHERDPAARGVSSLEVLLEWPGVQVGANSVVITDVPPNSTVVGNPGHVVRVDGRRPEGPDADWIHLPDPVADAIRELSGRLTDLERRLAALAGEEPPAQVRRLRPVRGRNPAGG